ncbi:MAG: nitroreductase family protein [bacterium]|nr:nitroreductase family protein [bacterium]
MNQVLETIKSRRSVRLFKPEPLKESELAAIIEAGCYAPSAMNGQPWHFTVVQNKDLLGRMVEQVRELIKNIDSPRIQERLKDPNWQAFYRAPAMVVVSGNKEAKFHQTDCAAATQNMLLAAASLGIGSCWIGIIAQLFESPKGAPFTKELMIPEGYQPLYAVALGYPDGEPPQAAPRKEDAVHYIR